MRACGCVRSIHPAAARVHADCVLGVVKEILCGATWVDSDGACAFSILLTLEPTAPPALILAENSSWKVPRLVSGTITSTHMPGRH